MSSHPKGDRTDLADYYAAEFNKLRRTLAAARKTIGINAQGFQKFLESGGHKASKTLDQLQLRRRLNHWPTGFSGDSPLEISSGYFGKADALIKDPPRAARCLAYKDAMGQSQLVAGEAAQLLFMASGDGMVINSPRLRHRLRQRQGQDNPEPGGSFWLGAVTSCLKQDYPDAFKDPPANEWAPIAECDASLACMIQLFRSATWSQCEAEAGARGTSKSLSVTRGKRHNRRKPPKDELVVDEKRLEARYGRDVLEINSGMDLRILKALLKRKGEVVKHHDLFIAAKPAEGKSVSEGMTEAQQEVKDAINHIRKAIKPVGAPYRIVNVKAVGYKLDGNQHVIGKRCDADLGCT